MAILKSNELGFKFQYSNFMNGCLFCKFSFLWKNQKIVNESLLKIRESWDKKPDGSFTAYVEGGESLIPFLKKVLKDDKADFWEPIDPDITIAVYPDDFFPFISKPVKPIYISDEGKKRLQARARLKKEKGKLPDDIFTVIVCVDGYNFKDTKAYQGSEIAINLIVYRNELERFVKELETEYEKFNKRFKVDEWFDKYENA